MQHEKEHQTKRQYQCRGFYPRQKDHRPISWMAVQCDFIGREVYAQPPFQITTHCVRGDRVNGKPENDEPEGRFVQFEEVARVAAAVCLPKELLAEAEIGNNLSFCAAKLVSFVVVGSLPFVGADFGCRKISSSEFRFERQSRLIGELLALIGDVQEFVFRQMLVSQHDAPPNRTLCTRFALDAQLLLTGR